MPKGIEAEPKTSSSTVNKDLTDVEIALDLDQITSKIKALPLEMQTLESDRDRLRLLYKDACSLMSLFFHGKDKELPIDALTVLVDIGLQLAVKSKDLLTSFIQAMPPVYRVESHSVNVFILSIFLGRNLDLQRTDLQQLALAALLHDIGKVGIDESIIEKNGKLDESEFEKIQEHSRLSVEIASKNMIRIKRVLDAILYHHENRDGSGYPEGLKGDEIPLFAQIIGICDVFDALTTEKTYRRKYGSFDAIMLIHKEMTHHFDPKITKTFIQLLHE